MAKGSIRRRSKKKNSWGIQVFLGTNKFTGKREFHTETVMGTHADAQRRLREVLGEVESDTYVSRSAETVYEFLERWLDEYGVSRLRARTLVGYRGYVSRYVPGWLGVKRLVDVRVEDISRFEVGMYRSGGEGGAPLSGRTVLQMHRILSSAFGYGVRQGLLARNVVRAVEPPRIRKFEVEALDWDGVGRLLSCVGDDSFRVLVMVALQTGLRRSELLGLQWRDVDLDRMQVSVRRSWLRVNGGGVRLEETKSGRSRVVDLMPESAEAIGRIRRLNAASGDLIFSSDGERAWDPDMVTRRFKEYARLAGYPGLRFHDLRHTHASLMLSQGVHLKVVSERLGHSSISITGDLYSHVAPTVQLEAVARFRQGWQQEVRF